MPSSCFCEAVRSHGIMQPANSLSSLAFVVVAVIVMVQWVSRRTGTDLPPNRFNARRAYPPLFVVALLVIGLGSAFYHAQLSYKGQFIDVLGMYFIATFALIYSIDRVRGLSAATVVSAYLGSNLMLAAMLWWVPVIRRVAFGLLIGGVILVELIGSQRSRAATVGGDVGKMQSARLLWSAVAVLGVAFIVWVLDYERILCSPQSLIQGHAVWHILGAVSAWLLYRYYREAGV